MRNAVSSRLFGIFRSSINGADKSAGSDVESLGSEKLSGRSAEAQSAQEDLICARLASYANVPVTDIFKLCPDWSPDGLTEDAVQAALAKYGPNVQSTHRPFAALFVLWAALMNPFNILLLVLAIVSMVTNDPASFGVMIAMVVASTSLRYWQEMKSMVQAQNLLTSVTTRVRVLRRLRDSGSEELEIDQRKVVPGDVLAVTSGDVFAGDCVLISSSALMVTQASLTGEIMAINKTVRMYPSGRGEAFDLLDNDNVCLAGTSVSAGSGLALVVSTGADTYMASIAQALAETQTQNAMQIGIRKVSYVLVAFMAVMVPTVFILRGAVSHDWKGAAMFAIAVAVGITPEMLPMIVTSNLALSAIRVACQKVIVKRFDAIQNLGAVSILCSDKTGTLTVDLVRIATSTTGSGAPSSLPLKLGFINSLLQTGTRSPIDRAIVDHVKEAATSQVFDDVLGDAYIKQGEIPFDSTRRLLSVLVTRVGILHGDGLLVTKGAVEEVLDRCVNVYIHPIPISDSYNSEKTPEPEHESLRKLKLDASTTVQLTMDERKRILDTAERLNEDGLRLVAVACRTALVKPFLTLTTSDETELTFIGLLGLLDPPKPDAADAIRELAKLNVQVRILTGDAPAVAAKVARDLGILSPPERVASIVEDEKHKSMGDVEMSPHVEAAAFDEKSLIVTGAQLAALANDKAAFEEVVERCRIFAKLSPYQKLQVVQTLRQGNNRAVAFLGDGVNDALAIRGADVGISVDSGTEIAKEAADVILLEKSLDVVAIGVIQGRLTMVNTIKYIKMTASSNFGNVFSLLVASAWLPYQPMLPIQLLIQNLLYDFSQASIPWDNVDPEYLIRPNTWSAKSIIRFMVCLGPFASPFDITTFCINWFHYKIRAQDSPLVPLAQTNWFLESSLTQLFIIHILRTGKIPVIQSRASTSVVLVTFGMACISMAIPYIPKLNTALQLTPPKPEYYGYLAAMVVGYAAVVHVVKTLYQLMFKEWL
ncbi:uncharacterized protein FIBRA_01205 [Fibroporia radiculosa]|uniref:Cation-transporting P-type ATPase N-terminal domain-containing protein n=1 Tax=Fibroporia radiculosa TaxID=599839 RepID=J4GJK2_9APHY|nr:uncharacterized protein FIBRA_01205 [Fibroporia radiculosa]CCL99190.1 predicted protein [Fibroporia radiculosa]